MAEEGLPPKEVTRKAMAQITGAIIVMAGMIAVVVLALLMVPVFFVSVQRVLARDREEVEARDANADGFGLAEPQKP